MAKPLPLYSKHPERVCWGCYHNCAAEDLAGGNGAERTRHPLELSGQDWHLLWDVEPDPRQPSRARS